MAAKPNKAPEPKKKREVEEGFVKIKKPHIKHGSRLKRMDWLDTPRRIPGAHLRRKKVPAEHKLFTLNTHKRITKFIQKMQQRAKERLPAVEKRALPYVGKELERLQAGLIRLMARRLPTDEKERERHIKQVAAFKAKVIATERLTILKRSEAFRKHRWISEYWIQRISRQVRITKENTAALVDLVIEDPTSANLSWEDETYEHLLDLCYRRKDVDRAAKVWAHMIKNSYLTDKAYAIYAKILATRGNLDKAKEILQKRIDDPETIGAETVATMVNYVGANNIEEAVKLMDLYKDMRDEQELDEDDEGDLEEAEEEEEEVEEVEEGEEGEEVKASEGAAKDGEVEEEKGAEPAEANEEAKGKSTSEEIKEARDAKAARLNDFYQGHYMMAYQNAYEGAYAEVKAELEARAAEKKAKLEGASKEDQKRAKRAERNWAKRQAKKKVAKAPLIQQTRAHTKKQKAEQTETAKFTIGSQTEGSTEPVAGEILNNLDEIEADVSSEKKIRGPAGPREDNRVSQEDVLTESERQARDRRIDEQSAFENDVEFRKEPEEEFEDIEAEEEGKLLGNDIVEVKRLKDEKKVKKERAPKADHSDRNVYSTVIGWALRHNATDVAEKYYQELTQMYLDERYAPNYSPEAFELKMGEYKANEIERREALKHWHNSVRTVGAHGKEALRKDFPDELDEQEVDIEMNDPKEFKKVFDKMKKPELPRVLQKPKFYGSEREFLQHHPTPLSPRLLRPLIDMEQNGQALDSLWAQRIAGGLKWSKAPRQVQGLAHKIFINDKERYATLKTVLQKLGMDAEKLTYIVPARPRLPPVSKKHIAPTASKWWKKGAVEKNDGEE